MNRLGRTTKSTNFYAEGSKALQKNTYFRETL